jgi:hypothetical protein
MFPADLLDPRVIDIAADTGSAQARDLASELVAWWYGCSTVMSPAAG